MKYNNAGHDFKAGLRADEACYIVGLLGIVPLKINA